MQQNHNTPFETLVEGAVSGLNKSYQELKSKYKDCPVCLMQYNENGKWTSAIEVRFDTSRVDLLLFFGDKGQCESSYLFFDKQDDENKFIDYLNTLWVYDYRKCHWQLTNCLLELDCTDGYYSFYFSPKLEHSVTA